MKKENLKQRKRNVCSKITCIHGNLADRGKKNKDKISMYFFYPKRHKICVEKRIFCKTWIFFSCKEGAQNKEGGNLKQIKKKSQPKIRQAV